MERGIIHNYCTSSRSLFEQAPGKPLLKKHSIGSMFIWFNRDMLPVAKASDDIHTMTVPPALGVAHVLAAFGVSVFPLKLFIYPTFVNIHAFLFRYFRQFAYIVLPFCFGLFFVGKALFFRVILSFSSACRIASPLQLNRSALSLLKSSGCASTSARNFSGSIFRHFLANALFSKLPVCAYFLCHAFSALELTPNASHQVKLFFSCNFEFFQRLPYCLAGAAEPLYSLIVKIVRVCQYVSPQFFRVYFPPFSCQRLVFQASCLCVLLLLCFQCAGAYSECFARFLLAVLLSLEYCTFP